MTSPTVTGALFTIALTCILGTVLLNRIDQLEQRIDRLERQIEALHGSPDSTASQPEVSTPVAQHLRRLLGKAGANGCLARPPTRAVARPLS